MDGLGRRRRRPRVAERRQRLEGRAASPAARRRVGLSASRRAGDRLALRTPEGDRPLGFAAEERASRRPGRRRRPRPPRTARGPRALRRPGVRARAVVPSRVQSRLAHGRAPAGADAERRARCRRDRRRHSRRPRPRRRRRARRAGVLRVHREERGSRGHRGWNACRAPSRLSSGSARIRRPAAGSCCSGTARKSTACRASDLVYAGDRPGVYRAEVWLPAGRAGGLVPWVVGNPIYIGERPSIGPLRQIPTGAGRPSGWTPRTSCGASNATRSRRRNSSDPPAASDCASRSRDAAETVPFAALDATTTIPPGSTGIAFRGRADRPMRLSVQIRVVTAGEGKRWQRSIYLDESDRDIVIPFADMTAVGALASGPSRRRERQDHPVGGRHREYDSRIVRSVPAGPGPVLLPASAGAVAAPARSKRSGRGSATSSR